MVIGMSATVGLTLMTLPLVLVLIQERKNRAMLLKTK